MTKLKKMSIFSKLLNVLLALLILLCTVTIVQVNTQGYVSIMGFSVFRVVSGSMEPEIPVGAMLISQKADIDDIEEGDVICFKSQNGLIENMIITHRVIEVIEIKGEKELKTKGDNNSIPDSDNVTKENLIGKVIWHNGKKTALTNFLSMISTPMGFVIFIAMPAAIVSSWIFRDATKKLKKELKGYAADFDDDSQVSLENLYTKEELEELRAMIKKEIQEEIEQTKLISPEEEKEIREELKRKLREELKKDEPKGERECITDCSGNSQECSGDNGTGSDSGAEGKSEIFDETGSAGEKAKEIKDKAI